MLRAALTGVLVLLMLVLSVGTVLADPPGNGVSCPTGRCGVGAVDPGAAGSPGAGPAIARSVSNDVTDGSTESSDSGAAGGSVVVPACTEQPMNPQPAADSVWWRGNSPADGVIVQWVCTGGTTPTTCTYCSDLTPHFAATGAAGAGSAAPPPPPDPAVLAQQAYQQIPIPKPEIHLGPNQDLVAVNIPVWLWISRAQVAPVTVTAGGVSVTATPALTSVSWSMGEPANPDSGGSTAPVVCSGEAMYTAAPEVVAPEVIPACGYSYQWRSLKSRTGGAGTWPVSASATWVITWTSNVGQSGTITAPPANSVTNLQVGEWQTVGVYAGSNSGG